ncbi:MAG: hypothetical protein PHF84_06425 [bacterium]|nr:hypothetical protein [bacterium]
MTEKKKLIIRLILCVFFSFILSYALIQSHINDIKYRETIVRVVVARNTILKNKMINTNDLITEEIPRQYCQPGSFTSPDLFLSRGNPRFYSLVDIYKGMQVSRTMIEPLTRSDIDLFIPDNMRAINMAVVDADLFNLLSPGSRIDFVLNQKKGSCFVLQNVLILKKGAMTLKSAGEKDQTVDKKYKSLTILLNKQDVLRFVFLMNKDFKLTCRALMDNKIVESRVIGMNDLMEDGATLTPVGISVDKILQTARNKIDRGENMEEEAKALTKKYKSIIQNRQIMQNRGNDIVIP